MTQAVLNRIVRTLWVFTIMCALASLAQGCGVGRGADGSIVVGTKVGELVETTNQAVAKVVEQYLPGFGTVAAAFGIPLVGAVAGWARSATKHAEIKGKEQGWDEREAAGTVQQPLGNGVPA